MSYAALMVHFDAAPSAYRRIHLAVDLANRFEAALIGIAGRSYVPTLMAEGLEIDAAGPDCEQDELDNLADLGREFRAAAKRVRHLEWRGRVEHASNLVSNEARAADLVIIGRETGSDDRDLALDPGIAILRAGRPVLIVPDEVDSLPARRIMLAWKDTRESRRAVSDALPFLKEATEVMIAEVCESGTETESLRSVEDVATYLRRHGVSVGAKVFLRAEHSVAGELLRFAKDENSDLIVAGGYGHSRLGEWVFGGVTRDLLIKSQVCCLFSH